VDSLEQKNGRFMETTQNQMLESSLGWLFAVDDRMAVTDS
jgi:hypothetical protein